MTRTRINVKVTPETDKRRASIKWTGTLNGQKFEVRVFRREVPTWKYSDVLRRSVQTSTWAEYEKKPRLYADFPGESLLDNLINRSTRPAAAIGRMVRPVLAHLGLTGKVGWYARAGCSMCPCSPGFIWSDAPALDFGDGKPTTRYDGWISLEGIPTVDDAPSAEATRIARMQSLGADPTLPLDVLASTRL